MIKLTKTQRGISAVEVVAALVIVGGLAWKFYPSGGIPAIFKKPLAEQYKICRDDFTQKTVGSSADAETLKFQTIEFVKICMERGGYKINEALLAKKIEARNNISKEINQKVNAESPIIDTSDPTLLNLQINIRESNDEAFIDRGTREVKTSCYLSRDLWCWQQ